MTYERPKNPYNLVEKRGEPVSLILSRSERKDAWDEGADAVEKAMKEEFANLLEEIIEKDLWEMKINPEPYKRVGTLLRRKFAFVLGEKKECKHHVFTAGKSTCDNCGHSSLFTQLV